MWLGNSNVPDFTVSYDEALKYPFSNWDNYLLIAVAQVSKKRSEFRFLPSKASVHRNSVLPALSRLLVGHNARLVYLLRELSIFIPPSPFTFCTAFLSHARLGLSKKSKNLLTSLLSF